MRDSVQGVLDQWGRERPDIDTWPIGIVGRIMRLSRLIDRELKEFLAGHGLEPGEFDVLSTLRRVGEPYELTSGAFLRTSLVTSGAITNRIDRMAAKGLVERIRGADDRRAVHIRLTEHGIAVIESVLPLHVENEARLLGGERTERLDRLTETLEEILLLHGDSATSG